MQLSVMQIGNGDLASLVEKAASANQGVPYSAIPEIKNGKPVVVVKLRLPDGSSKAVDVSIR